MKPLHVGILLVVAAVGGGMFTKWQTSRNVAPMAKAVAPARIFRVSLRFMDVLRGRVSATLLGLARPYTSHCARGMAERPVEVAIRGTTLGRGARMPVGVLNEDQMSVSDATRTGT